MFTKEQHFTECLNDIKDNVPSDWEYVGWYGDECPSYQVNGFHVYVDHPEPQKRTCELRFGIGRINEHGEWLEDVAEFDDLSDVLDFVKSESK
ncbi:hypothetical protein [uncultured Mediterranean phage uvMED]|nr:hypothetical protein [uncultured Mediterranean phage uvMED]|tara:strand:+ start:154 stop:432 length:279 start_codon:yes stop_codon:yes gene_type:complete